ncbi:MAG TPA: hypothetical protein VJT32_00385 [bacterium]|nr:hypothetical protein [bacterium]
MRLRAPSGQDLEWRERTAKIRTAARSGKSSVEIAEVQHLPIAAVERILAPIEHSRISDPVCLLQKRRVTAGTAPAEIQLYWLGFLMAAGYIWGQGSSLALVVTLGAESRAYIDTFMADLSTDRIYCEFCYSNIVGWQVYLRDKDLCKALFPWGVPSELHGNDSALLDDLPGELAIPFIRGYVDGNWSFIHSSNGPREGRFAVEGTPVVLARLRSLMKRCWRIRGGTVSSRGGRATLRFSDPGACRVIQSHLGAFVSRVRT